MTDLSPRDAEIQRRWLLGESSGVIGKHLHMTRNSVIGIVHRRVGNVPRESRQTPLSRAEAKSPVASHDHAYRAIRTAPTGSESLTEAHRASSSLYPPALASNRPDGLFLPLDGL